MFALVLAGATLAACDNPFGSDTELAAGVYHLRTIGDAPLPAPVYDDRGRVQDLVHGATLRLSVDGRYAWSQSSSISSNTFERSGSFELSGTRLELAGKNGRYADGILTIEDCVDGLPCLFVREGTDAGPARTYRAFGLRPGHPCCDVLGGRVWLWRDGTYLRHVATLLPSPYVDRGTYQLSGSVITLSGPGNPGSPGLTPLTGTLDGQQLTLGRFSYDEIAVPF